MKLIRESAKQLLVQKQFSMISGTHPGKPLIAALSIGGFCFSLGLLVPPLAWANNFKSVSTLPPVPGRLSSQASTAGENAALLERGLRLNTKNWSKRAQQGILSQDVASTINRSIHSPPIPKEKCEIPISTRLRSLSECQRSVSKAIPGVQDPSVPYLLAPRLGQVRGPTPTVRWNGVAGVRRYHIRLLRDRDGKVLWYTVVESNRITLPGQPNLKPGELYQVVVEAEGDNGTSSRMEPCSDGLNFSVLPPADVKVLEQKLVEIRSQRGSGATPENLPLREAEVLAMEDLKTEAFDLLNKHEQKKPSPQGQFMLGELANSQGLNQLAQGYFSQAAKLASQVGDAEGVRKSNKSEDLARSLADLARQGKCEPGSDTVPSRSAP